MASDDAGPQDEGSDDPAGTAWSEAAGRIGPAAPPPWAAPVDAAPPTDKAEADPGQPADTWHPAEPGTSATPQAAPPLRTAADAYGTRSYGAGSDSYSANDRSGSYARSSRPFSGPYSWSGTPSRYRRRGGAGGAVVALVFVIVSIVIGATDHHSSSSSFPTIDTADQPPAEHLTLALGQPATIQAVIGYNDVVQPTYGSVTITPTAVTQPATMAGASDVNATLKLTVCAGSQAITPGTVFVDALYLQAGQDTPVMTGIGDNSTSASLGNELQPGQCATGIQGFNVPGGATVTQVTFGGLLDPQQAVWNV